MTHADARSRLRAYADGTLGDDDAEGVRAHIATGCHECLSALFTRPVGLPRIGPAPAVVPPIPPPTDRAYVVGLALGGAMLGCLVGVAWMRSSESRMAAEAARVGELAEEITRLRADRASADAAARTRIERLEARLAESERREAPAAPPPGIPPSGEPPAGDLDASAPPASPPAVGEPRESDAGPGAIEPMLSSQGTRAIALEPSTFAPEARGYAVWSPKRGVVLVSAKALAVQSGLIYRACITLTDGSTVWVGDLRASARGTLNVTVVLPPGRTRRVSRVDLYRDPPGIPMLTGRL